MSDHLLGAIIALEKELQLEVQAESARATAWRERQFAALTREAQETRTALEIARGEALAAARLEAAAAGERAQTATESWCAQLATISEERCRAHLAPLLRRLLPEAGDDHPHDQN